MNPILQQLAGLTFLMVAEAGIISSNFTRTVQREWIFVYDGTVGYDVGFVGHNPDAQYTIHGKRTGAAGLAAASPCVALTLANATNGNGVDTGTVFTQTLGDSHAEKAFRELNITAIQKPGIV